MTWRTAGLAVVIFVFLVLTLVAGLWSFAARARSADPARIPQEITPGLIVQGHVGLGRKVDLGCPALISIAAMLSIRGPS